jgi:hypothetical protein
MCLCPSDCYAICLTCVKLTFEILFSLICVPDSDIVQLKKRYKWRIFVDESCSFGVLGKTGRGISEHADVPFLSMDLMVASMACSLASVGGFCAGNYEVVDHQRLNGAGYVFSASQPPFTATAASVSVTDLQVYVCLLLCRVCLVVHQRPSISPQTNNQTNEQATNQSECDPASSWQLHFPFLDNSTSACLSHNEQVRFLRALSLCHVISMPI